MPKEFFQNPDDRFDTEMRFKALEGGAESHIKKMGEENRMGVPSYDESVVSDWIRHRVDLPDDMIEGTSIFKVDTVRQPEGDYEADLIKLKTITSSQLREILNAVEDESKEGRGLFSKGNLLDGYAIDRKTLKSFQSTHHDGVEFDLAKEVIQDLRNAGMTDPIDLNDILRTIVKGYVYLKVADFKAPIVKLFLGMKGIGNQVLEEDVQKIVNHIKGQRKLLPISSDFRVL